MRSRLPLSRTERGKTHQPLTYRHGLLMIYFQHPLLITLTIRAMSYGLVPNSPPRKPSSACASHICPQRRLTALRVGHDKHIHVDSEDRRLVIQERPGPGGPGPRPRYLEGPPPAARVSEFKHLTGNVGYIRVDRMLPADGPNDSMDTAMAALQGSKALIIDLRHIGGGDPSASCFVNIAFRAGQDLCRRCVRAYLALYLLRRGRDGLRSASAEARHHCGRNDRRRRKSRSARSVAGSFFHLHTYG